MARTNRGSPFAAHWITQCRPGVDGARRVRWKIFLLILVRSMDRPPIQIRPQMLFRDGYRQGLILTTLLLVCLFASLVIAAAVPPRFGIWILIAAPFLFVGVLIV